MAVVIVARKEVYLPEVGETFTISVEESSTIQAKKGDACDCPAARTFRQHFGGKLIAETCAISTSLRRRGSRRILAEFLHSDELREAIVAWDHRDSIRFNLGDFEVTRVS